MPVIMHFRERGVAVYAAMRFIQLLGDRFDLDFLAVGKPGDVDTVDDEPDLGGIVKLSVVHKELLKP
jgi:hypothetical protein